MFDIKTSNCFEGICERYSDEDPETLRIVMDYYRSVNYKEINCCSNCRWTHYDDGCIYCIAAESGTKREGDGYFVNKAKTIVKHNGYCDNYSKIY